MQTIDWGNSAISLRFAIDDGPVRLIEVDATDRQNAPTPRSTAGNASQGLVEILTPQWGNGDWGSCNRISGTRIGDNLRYVSHQTTTRDDPSGSTIRTLSIVQADAESGLRTTSRLIVVGEVPAVRAETEVSLLADAAPVTLWAVTSLATGAMISHDRNLIDVWYAETSWCAENRWQSRPLRSPGLVGGQDRIGIDPKANGATVRDSVRYASIGSWSSGSYLPAGAVQDRSTGRTLAWQIEHNGGWQWEVGERGEGTYLALLGPNDALHQWSYTVDAGRSFCTVPVTFAVGEDFSAAFGRLADYRRAVRRPHPRNDTLPVIFNDYMNTLMGDPSEEKLLPLINAAASVGCEYFCIDAGWYDDTDGWWSSVGDWQPSTVRFPNGLRSVLDHIRDRGMVPGLWLEPEVVGVTAEAAASLPDEAFLQRGGVRIRERSRYLLDLRSRAAVDHLDAAVDRLVSELGVGYFKFDYNVTPGSGTDLDAESVGQGLLEHNRALLDWLDRLLDRHPELIIENCGSGAMRSDFAMLSRLALQSTSDQEDPRLYPAVAAGALVHLLPEQAANWAYPQPEMDPEMINFTMCTGLAGRLYQSGRLDRMDADQIALVSAGIAVHRSIRADLERCTPYFPNGLPGWDKPWTSVALCADDVAYLIVWRQASAPRGVDLELPEHHRGGRIEQLYPPPGQVADWECTQLPTGLQLTSTGGVAARMYKITRMYKMS